MENDEYRKGYFRFKPYYVIDEETGEIVPTNLPADAVIPQAKPGSKAGNSLLDEINESLQDEGKIEEIISRNRKIIQLQPTKMQDRIRNGKRPMRKKINRIGRLYKIYETEE